MEDHEAYTKAYTNSELDEYEGKWVVFVKGKLVAAGGDLKEMVEKVWKEHGKETVPFVTKVPKRGYMALGQIPKACG